MTKIKFQMRNVAAIAACLAVTMFASCKKDTPDLNGTVTISPTANVFTGTELTAAYSGTEKVTWQWNKNETAINGATAEKYTPTEAGIYTVTAISTGYNSKTSAAVEVKSFIVSGTLGAGLSDYTKVSVKFRDFSWDFADEDQNYDSTAPVSSGKFNLTLATPAAENLQSVKEFWMWKGKPEITFSDQNAKVSKAYFIARKYGETRMLLILTNYTDGSVSSTYVYYVYADRKVDITGSFGSATWNYTYDVKLKKGWNNIVETDTKGSDDKWTVSFTANGAIPTDLKWEID